LLNNHNFTIESLLSSDPSDLSCILTIDHEVAAIMLTAVKKKTNTNNHFTLATTSC